MLVKLHSLSWCADSWMQIFTSLVARWKGQRRISIKLKSGSVVNNAEMEIIDVTPAATERELPSNFKLLKVSIIFALQQTNDLLSSFMMMRSDHHITGPTQRRVLLFGPETHVSSIEACDFWLKRYFFSRPRHRCFGL